ncbi:hypothetical protein ABT346_21835 [Micromonospora peucetia]|uniref:hypothetical protein n=1 Tax=Micromonospora peucetia TaxID=47871 RepID=UPI003331B93D
MSRTVTLVLVDAAAPVLSEWCARWRAEAPGYEPERAVELLRSVVALRMAAVYAMFLDGIEASERVYHATDVDTYLEKAVAQVAASA